MCATSQQSALAGRPGRQHLSTLTHGQVVAGAARVPLHAAVIATGGTLVTFPGRDWRRRRSKALSYGAIQAVGSGINLLIFGLCLAAVPRLAAMPVIPFAAGAGVAMVFNYVALKRLLYARERTALEHT